MPTLSITDYVPATIQTFATGVTVDATGKVFTRTGLVPGKPFIVYGDDVELGRATVDSTGQGVVTLSAAPGVNVVLTFGLVISGILNPYPAGTPMDGVLDFSDAANSGLIPGL